MKPPAASHPFDARSQAMPTAIGAGVVQCVEHKGPPLEAFCFLRDWKFAAAGETIQASVATITLYGSAPVTALLLELGVELGFGTVGISAAVIGLGCGAAVAAGVQPLPSACGVSSRSQGSARTTAKVRR